ncbi:hypothetical protein [Pseudonocardia humida]|uniref:Uncharacterized protein n=1 Tax=Pseudonocardia humida TaxID=2800819 RepID=A0ABT1AD60_9PSEU|nr:hypothetical protein [Pseudonocardia humida]MCO1660990.1 hypothetical protein [Pseudonocardia humida]
MFLAGPFLSQAADLAKNAANPKVMRAAALERIKRQYSKKIDLRCAEICTSAIEGRRSGKLEPCAGLPANVDALGL